jgi:uncharacterized damage-inducible protein DinB
MAEYGLCLFRLRGRQPADVELMDSAFRKQFSRGSTPVSDAVASSSPEQIRATFNTVHQRALEELATYRDADLGDSIDQPYAVEATKLGALYFCAAHEMLHAGQIGLLRRMLGKQPVR